MENGSRKDLIVLIPMILFLITLVIYSIHNWGVPLAKEAYIIATTGETSLQQSRDAVAEKKNPTIEDYINAEYTFFLDGNKVLYPEKLNEDHYKIDTVDNDNYEVILERSDKMSQ